MTNNVKFTFYAAVENQKQSLTNIMSFLLHIVLNAPVKVYRINASESPHIYTNLINY